MASQSIFISYRRTDTGGHVRSLYERLRMQFRGNRLFFDRSSIESGDVFPDTLRQEVERCAVLLALIGPEWLDVQDKNGARRLDDPDDFVRREIALALELGKVVIPVLYEDAPVPCDRLPDELKALPDRQALMLRTRGDTDEYEASLQKLIERINLLGTWQDLRDLCKATTYSRMSAVQKQDGSQKDLYKDLYLERRTVRQHMDNFLAAREKRGFILLGKSGVGKSLFLLHLADELHASSDMCVLVHAGINLSIDTSSALTNIINYDLRDVRLSGQPVQQVWDDIARIIEQNEPKRIGGLGKRQFVFCVDAVNENQQPSELVWQLNNLIQESWVRWPWLKIIFSARPETWQPIKRAARGLAEDLYYRGTESESLRRGLEPFSYSARMEPFSYDELPAVYGKYKLRFEWQTNYEELSHEQRDMLRDPFHLWLLSGQNKIPKDATNIIDGYVAAMEERDKLVPDTLKLFLMNELLPLMVGDGRYSNVITNAQIIYDLRQSPLFLSLCDADILMLDQQITEYGRKEERIRFKYERFYEHFAGERISELSTTPERLDKHAFFVALIEETARKPFFWGPVRNALIKEASTPNSETIPKLCHTKEQREKEMMVNVLTGLGSIEQVEGILRALIPQEREASEWQKMRYLVRTPAGEADERTRNARKIAIEVASTRKLVTLLQSAALHTDPTMRALAVRYSYYVWQHDRDAAFAIVQDIASKSTAGVIPNRLGLESIFALSLIIICDSYQDEEALGRLRSIWQGMIAKLFRVREDDSKWKRFVRDFLRERIIAVVISHVFGLLRELPANNMMNYEALQAFFHLSLADKDLYRRLVRYVDAQGDYSREQMKQDYLAVLKLDNVLTRLTTTMGLIAHTWAAPHAFLPFLKQLFEAAKSNVVTYPYLRAIHNVPISLLQRNPRMNDEIFDFFVYTAEVSQECYTQHPEKYQGEASGPPPQAPGIGSYINFQYLREGTVKTPWLETRIQAALKKPDLKLFEFLLSAEFPDQAVNNQAPQAVLEALELFFKSGNAEITDMIRVFLSRLRVYYPDLVEDFLAQQEAPDDFRLQVRIHEPSERVGDLIGMRAWYFVRDSALLGPAERCAELRVFFEKAAEYKDTRGWMNYVIRHLVNVIYGEEVLRESV